MCKSVLSNQSNMEVANQQSPPEILDDDLNEHELALEGDEDQDSPDTNTMNIDEESIH